VQALVRWIHRAEQSDYYKWRLAQHLGNLSWQVMAYREGTTPQDLRDRLRAGRLDLPPIVLAYLEGRKKGRIGGPSSLMSRLERRLGLRERSPSLDPALEEIVRFLEEQMEVDRELS
jgi:hypothetical protein